MVKRLNRGRKSAGIALPSFHTTIVRSLWVPELIKKLRTAQPNNRTIVLSKPPLLSILSNYGSISTPSIHYIQPQTTSYKPLIPIIDILTSEIFGTDPRGGLTVPIIRGEPRVFLPLGIWENAGRVEIASWMALRSGVGSSSPDMSGSPTSPRGHRKRSSFGPMLSWLGVGKGSEL